MKSAKGEARAPKPEDFKAEAVRRAVFWDTIQHPMTILPAAVSGVGALYIGLLGLDIKAFAVTFASAFLAAGAWVFNYFIRGDDLAREKVDKLLAERRRMRGDVVKSLIRDWQDAFYPEGLQQSKELDAAYHRLDKVLTDRLAKDVGPGFTMQRLRALAEDTYREGISILTQALEVRKSIKESDRDKLERELALWQDARNAPGAKGLEALDTRIAAHQRRLGLIEAQQKKLDDLLAESETLEAALESTALEVVDLSNPEALFSRGSAAEELERAMNAAQRAEERIRGTASAPDEDDIYLKAGQSPD